MVWIFLFVISCCMLFISYKAIKEASAINIENGKAIAYVIGSYIAFAIAILLISIVGALL